MFPFRDRRDAGRQLARLLTDYRDRDDVIVLALPRGGVPVGYEVATALHVPLDVFVVRKLGVPGHEELAMGAIASGGVRVLNDDVVWSLGIAPEALDAVTRAETRELARREEQYRGHRPPPPLAGRCVILIDDGLATGSTMRAAAESVRRRGAAHIVVAVPVAAFAVCSALEHEALVDEVVCLQVPEPFFAVGAWYRDFRQIDDDEVRGLLDAAGLDAAAADAGAP